MTEKMKVACFSGHRKLPQDCEAYINKLNEEYLKILNTELQANLEKAIIELIERGVVFFGSGAALGFDLLAATTVLRLKKYYPHIKLVMVLPCPPEQQSLKWNDKQKKRYNEILKQADKKRILSPQYTNSCMLDRNRHMVDNSAYLICYLREQYGGTFYTANYAERNGLKIRRL